MKSCSKCKSNKLEEQFPFKNKVKGIRSSVCSICQREYKLKHYYSNKQQYYDRNKVTLDRLTEIANEYKETHSCEKCGENDTCCLDFHHIDRDKKDDTISNLRNMGSEKKLLIEIGKCIVLCSNCHRKLHAGRFEN